MANRIAGKHGDLWRARTALWLIVLIPLGCGEDDPASGVDGNGEPSPGTAFNVAVVNDDGGKYDEWAGLDPHGYYYFFNFKACDGGLGSLYLTTDLDGAYEGEIAHSDALSGTFYATAGGSPGYFDTVILLVSVEEGGIGDDFSLEINTRGYELEINNKQKITFHDETPAYNEIFDAEDFSPGPAGVANWKYSGCEGGYPLIEDGVPEETGFVSAVIDLWAGAIGPDAEIVGRLENEGAVEIEYAFSGLEGLAVFNVYGYRKWDPKGKGVHWTNRTLGAGANWLSVGEAMGGGS